MAHALPDLNRFPESLWISLDQTTQLSAMQRSGADGSIWELQGVRVTLQRESSGRFSVSLESPTLRVRQIALRWNHVFQAGTTMLGDDWERNYGMPEWRGYTATRVMPWYFLASQKNLTAGYGVMTGAGSMACWKTSHTDIMLSLDVRAGGMGVELGQRVLKTATIVYRAPVEGESSFAAARALCRELSPRVRMPSEPVVGHNDWYWLYGKNSATQILEATSRFMDLYPKNCKVKPWSVIDDGWQTSPEEWLKCNGGSWNQGNALFGDMASLAAKIKQLGARPGIWMRPLLTRAAVPEAWKLKRQAEGVQPLDPSRPEVLELVHSDVRRLSDWGYELVKHDFSTFDVTGLWGPEMPGVMGFAPDGWHFADDTHTTAEILLKLYQTIREAAGEKTILIGCNTVGHLAAGLVEMQRIGDDTSASDWDRTRRMGVNTLAFRAAQHGAFFSADADCVPVSPHIHPEQTAAWLDLVARSGTPLFLSIDPTALDESAKEQIRAALEHAVKDVPVAEPLDWKDTPTPTKWKLQGQQTPAEYSWRHR